MTIYEVRAAMGRLAEASVPPNHYVDCRKIIPADLRACAEAERMLGVLRNVICREYDTPDEFWQAIYDIDLTPPGGASAHSDLNGCVGGPTEQAAAVGETNAIRGGVICICGHHFDAHNWRPCITGCGCDNFTPADRAPSEEQDRPIAPRGTDHGSGGDGDRLPHSAVNSEATDPESRAQTPGQSGAAGTSTERCGCGLTMEQSAFNYDTPGNGLGHSSDFQWARCVIADRTRERDEARVQAARDHAIAEAARRWRKAHRLCIEEPSQAREDACWDLEQECWQLTDQETP